MHHIDFVCYKPRQEMPTVTQIAVTSAVTNVSGTAVREEEEGLLHAAVAGAVHLLAVCAVHCLPRFATLLNTKFEARSLNT